MAGRLHFSPRGRLFFWYGAVGPPLFDEDGRPYFTQTGLVMTAERCIGCLCCGNDLLGYTACRFNRNSEITGYVYRGYRAGVLVNSFIGNRNFPKQPRGGGSFVENSGQSTAQACCFCQEYIYTAYNTDGGIAEQRITRGAGTSHGFCYTITGAPGSISEGAYPGGWWDGNEAGATVACTGRVPPDVELTPCFKPPCRYGTFFSCGVCCGLVKVRYWYNCPPPGAPASSGASSYADVYFTVINPDCCDFETEYGEEETVLNQDFSSRLFSGSTADGEGTGFIGWLTDRGAEPSSAEFHSADQSLFISGSRSSKITAPDENYTDFQLTMPRDGNMEFYAYQTASGTLDLDFTANGVSKWNSVTDSLPNETWTKVTVPLSAGSNYLRFTSTHDAGNSASDGHFIDTIRVTA